MTTILVVFLISLVLALALTPLAGKLGVRFGALDVPSKRKVHAGSIPRCGGLVIFVAFFLTLVLSTFFMTYVSNLLVMDREALFFLFGVLVVFGVGLFDDFHRLGYKIKFLFQIIGASVAFWGGIRIGGFAFFGMSLEFGWISYFVTVFWFLLFINAVNLIDGLDGLAAGVCFFASLVMVFLLTVNGNFLYAMLFSSLAGALFGFLWYNFNPASIFMGDGGSYFLGYTIAGLSIMCSSKSHIGAVMLIPVLALGVPIFDTILSPVRRFIVGSGMFKADKGHIHHRLVEIGISTRKVVYIIYGISVCLCAFALLLVNFRDEQVGLFLIVLGVALLVFIRRLGYFEYFASDKIFGWLKDISDEVGISQDRRTFLSIQMSVAASDTIYQLWSSVIQAAEKIHLSTMALELDPGAFGGSFLPTLTWKNGVKGGSVEEEKNGHSLRLEAPIVLNGKVYATVHLSKSLEHWNCDRLVLRRIEHLRRSISSGLEKIALRSSISPEVLEDRRRPDNHNTKKWNGHERRKE